MQGRGAKKVCPKLPGELFFHQLVFWVVRWVSENLFKMKLFYINIIALFSASLGESLLIAKFAPIWNKLIDGFGNHDPDKGRYGARVPSGIHFIQGGDGRTNALRGLKPRSRYRKKLRHIFEGSPE